MHVIWLGLLAGTLRAPPTKPSISFHHLVSDKKIKCLLSSRLKTCKNDKNIEKIAVSRFKIVQNNPTLANMKFNDLNAMFHNSVLHTLIQ